jgi:hypothetical protein
MEEMKYQRDVCFNTRAEPAESSFAKEIPSSKITSDTPYAVSKVPSYIY